MSPCFSSYTQFYLPCDSRTKAAGSICLWHTFLSLTLTLHACAISFLPTLRGIPSTWRTGLSEKEAQLVLWCSPGCWHQSCSTSRAWEKCCPQPESAQPWLKPPAIPQELCSLLIITPGERHKELGSPPSYDLCLGCTLYKEHSALVSS